MLVTAVPSTSSPSLASARLVLAAATVDEDEVDVADGVTDKTGTAAFDRGYVQSPQAPVAKGSNSTSVTRLIYLLSPKSTYTLARLQNIRKCEFTSMESMPNIYSHLKGGYRGRRLQPPYALYDCTVCDDSLKCLCSDDSTWNVYWFIDSTATNFLITLSPDPAYSPA